MTKKSCLETRHSRGHAVTSTTPATANITTMERAGFGRKYSNGASAGINARATTPLASSDTCEVAPTELFTADPENRAPTANDEKSDPMQLVIPIDMSSAL